MSDKPEKRNLPSWMSSKSHPKKHDEDNDQESENKPGTSKNNGESANKAKGASSSGGRSFSKLLEGVVFVLSGFVNPERSALRSQALEMGAEYKQDWNGDSTLLVCAFPNTPKFRQVQADCGTIVSKEWISECYSQKKLVDIETYLMHAGKPWRKSNSSHEVDQDQGSTPPDKLHKKGEGKPSAAPSKVGAPDHVKKQFSPTEVKKWANDDLTKTIAWLESRDEKPEPSEVKKIAVEGILTCLQDALEALEQNQDIQRVTEQWNFIPHVVEELARLEGVKGGKRSLSRKDILQEAVSCKHIYDRELNSLGDDSTVKKKKQKANEGDKERTADAASDSDDTIEMTEEEIDLAYKTIATKVFK